LKDTSSRRLDHERQVQVAKTHPTLMRDNTNTPYLQLMFQRVKELYLLAQL
jgi:hypothetical protein